MSDMRDQIRDEARRKLTPGQRISADQAIEVAIDAAVRVFEPALLAEQVAATERADTLAGRLQQAEARLTDLAEDLDRRTKQARERGDGMRAMDWGYAARKVRSVLAALDRPGEDPPATPRTDREETR